MTGVSLVFGSTVSVRITGTLAKCGVGYWNTDGLGLAEYMNWCVDLNVEPILAVWAGMYLDTNRFISQADLGPYVQDTLNELEYIMGDTSTTYGALRASHGYPEPWTVNYVEIGNEDNGYGAWE